MSFDNILFINKFEEICLNIIKELNKIECKNIEIFFNHIYNQLNQLNLNEVERIPWKLYIEIMRFYLKQQNLDKTNDIMMKINNYIIEKPLYLLKEDNISIKIIKIQLYHELQYFKISKKEYKELLLEKENMFCNTKALFYHHSGILFMKMKKYEKSVDCFEKSSKCYFLLNDEKNYHINVAYFLINNYVIEDIEYGINDENELEYDEFSKLLEYYQTNDVIEYNKHLPLFLNEFKDDIFLISILNSFENQLLGNYLLPMMNIYNELNIIDISKKLCCNVDAIERIIRILITNLNINGKINEIEKKWCLFD